LEEPETLGADQLQDVETEAKTETEKAGLGLTMFTDGPLLDGGVAGYAVVTKNFQA